MHARHSSVHTRGCQQKCRPHSLRRLVQATVLCTAQHKNRKRQARPQPFIAIAGAQDAHHSTISHLIVELLTPLLRRPSPIASQPVCLPVVKPKTTQSDDHQPITSTELAQWCLIPPSPDVALTHSSQASTWQPWCQGCKFCFDASCWSRGLLCAWPGQCSACAGAHSGALVVAAAHAQPLPQAHPGACHHLFLTVCKVHMAVDDALLGLGRINPTGWCVETPAHGRPHTACGAACCGRQGTPMGHDRCSCDQAHSCAAQHQARPGGQGSCMRAHRCRHGFCSN
mmetsp:Transcript_34210/g.86543  ORF Transcript_34210/g.86543 Transcript_34210/m.86543 type:complete len:284 (-) Transcript_34210:128-979(-)